jgi:hypothetical protein
MKKLNDLVLYFHDYMTNEEETQEEVRRFQRDFFTNGIQIDNIETTDNPPFNGNKSYDILLFDWGGASIGNSNMRHFCRYILDEAIEKPSRIYIMVSSFTADAMKEALDDFKQANGELPANVFLNITDACKLLVA